MTRTLGAAVVCLVLVGLAVVFRNDIRGLRDGNSGSDDPETVVVLREGATADGGPPGTWTIDVAPGEMLIVDAASVELVRDDQGSRIDNANPDRILLAAEGGHPYTLTLADGWWAVTAEVDGRRAFCDRRQRRDGEWGVEYRPSSWSSAPC